jgi:hypothetical protein
LPVGVLVEGVRAAARGRRPASEEAGGNSLAAAGGVVGLVACLGPGEGAQAGRAAGCQPPPGAEGSGRSGSAAAARRSPWEETWWRGQPLHGSSAEMASAQQADLGQSWSRCR